MRGESRSVDSHLAVRHATILKKLLYRDIGYHTVAFSPRRQWLALGSRDLQLWLKVNLTEEEYQAVKAAEERAASASHREDLLYSLAHHSGLAILAGLASSLRGLYFAKGALV